MSAPDCLTGLTNRRAHVLLAAATAVLLMGAALYHVKGIRLLFGEKGGDDYHQRWIEVRYAARGQNPYDVYRTSFGRGPQPWHEDRDARLDSELGYVYEGGYPPWAFVFGWLFVWPSWPAALGYFLALSIGAVILIGCWAAALAPGRSIAQKGFLFAAALAVSACGTTLQVGQYGTLVAACLAGALWLIGRDRQVLGGLLLGVALIKPTIAGPFVLALLIAGRYRAVGVSVLSILGAAVLVWVRTHTNPVEMCLQMLASGAEFVDDSQGLIRPLLALGLGRQLVTPVLAAGILLPATLLMIRFRHGSLLELFAIAAVTARLWSYHKSYDDMMLIFLLAPLLAAWLRYPHNLLAGAAALLVGITLWAPASLMHRPSLASAELLIWPAGLAVLLYLERAAAPLVHPLPSLPITVDPVTS